MCCCCASTDLSCTVAVQEWLQALQAVLVQRALDAAERPNMHPETVRACLQQLEERASLLHAELAALQALHLTRDRDARMQVGNRVLFKTCLIHNACMQVRHFGVALRAAVMGTLLASTGGVVAAGDRSGRT